MDIDSKQNCYIPKNTISLNQSKRNLLRGLEEITRSGESDLDPLDTAAVANKLSSRFCPKTAKLKADVERKLTEPYLEEVWKNYGG